MEKKLMEQLGMQVTITHREGEAGGVVVRYKTFDQPEFSVPPPAGRLAEAANGWRLCAALRHPRDMREIENQDLGLPGAPQTLARRVMFLA
jgi:hypothetical protein